MQDKQSPDDSLRTLLQAWRLEDSLPPRFQQEVWRRIEGTGRPGSVTLWSLFRQWLEAALARPALAVAYVAVLITLGLALGFHQGQSHSSRAEARLAAGYVQSIDPYQKPAH